MKVANRILVNISIFFAMVSVSDSNNVSKKVSAITVARVRKAPQIDGKLDDVCWKKTRFISFPRKKDNKKIPQKDYINYQTEFAVVRDDWGIYIAIRCYEPNLSSLVETCEVRDGLWEYFRRDDKVEILLDPSRTLHDYYWFQVNPKGIKTDICAQADPDRSWNGVWQVATGREKKAWTVEIFIPFVCFNRGYIGDEWGIHIARFIAHRNKRISWGGEYRKPWTWPVLKGLKRKQSIFNYEVSSLSLTPLPKPGWGKLSAKITNHTGSKVHLYPIFQIMRPCSSRGIFPQATGPREEIIFNPVILRDNASVNLSGKIKIDPEEIVLGQLILKDEKGHFVFCSRDRGFYLQHLIDGPGPEFNYYTNEIKARLRFNLRRIGKKMQLNLILLSNGKEVLKHTLNADKSEIIYSIPIADIPIGRHKILARLVEDGKVIAERTYPIVRLTPKKIGSEVKIRRWSRSIVIDGKPFVPIGTSPLVPHHGIKYGENMMRMMADNHFNAMHLWGGFVKRDKNNKMLAEFKWDWDKLSRCFDGARNAHLKVIVSIGTLVLNNPKCPFTKYSFTDDERIAMISKLVMALRDREELLGYEIVDEPGFFIAPEWTERVYQTIKKLDPYHLVTINNCRGSRSVLPFLEATDTVGIDYYPIGKWPASTVAPLTDELVQFARWKPVKWWIQGYKIYNPKAPSSSELKAMTYMVVAHGASSVFYFIGKSSENLWRTEGECAEELQVLTDAVTADLQQKLITKPHDTPVYASYRKNKGKRWIIAINESAVPVNVEIILPRDITNKTSINIHRLFEEGKVNYQDGKIKDHFDPWERHVYEIIPGYI